MLRDEWTEAIQMVADKLQRQEEERIQCSPTSNIDNMVEEEMDISTTHHKRKVTGPRTHRCAQIQCSWAAPDPKEVGFGRPCV